MKDKFRMNSVLFIPKIVSVIGLFSGISTKRIPKAAIKKTKLISKEIIEIRCLEKNPRLLKPSPILIIYHPYKRISLKLELNLNVT